MAKVAKTTTTVSKGKRGSSSNTDVGKKRKKLTPSKAIPLKSCEGEEGKMGDVEMGGIHDNNNQPKKQKADPLVPEDFQVKLDKFAKVRDMSGSDKQYHRDKFLLDEKHYAQICSVEIKSRGVVFDQFVIGRESPNSDPLKKPFKMCLPMKVIPALRNALNSIEIDQTKPTTIEPTD